MSLQTRGSNHAYQTNFFLSYQYVNYENMCTKQNLQDASIKKTALFANQIHR